MYFVSAFLEIAEKCILKGSSQLPQPDCSLDLQWDLLLSCFDCNAGSNTDVSTVTNCLYFSNPNNFHSSRRPLETYHITSLQLSAQTLAPSNVVFAGK